MPNPSSASANNLLSTLQQRTLIGDGGMGTQLMAAGCDAATTNTFGGNRITLAGHALEEKVAAISAAAAKLAKEASPWSADPPGCWATSARAAGSWSRWAN